MKLRLPGPVVALVAVGFAAWAATGCGDGHAFGTGESGAGGDGVVDAGGAGAGAPDHAAAGEATAGRPSGGEPSQGGAEQQAEGGAGAAGGTSGAACAVDATRPCSDDERLHALGNCAAGTETCSNDAWSACSIDPIVQDGCTTGDDANCNGMPNEGCTCVNDTEQPCGPPVERGICRQGVQTCVNSKWGTCVDAVFAGMRDCTSSLDNDCNGVVDKLDATCACQGASSRACNQHPGKDGVGPCKAGTEACVVSVDAASSSWERFVRWRGPSAVEGLVQRDGRRRLQRLGGR